MKNKAMKNKAMKNKKLKNKKCIKIEGMWFAITTCDRMVTGRK